MCFYPVCIILRPAAALSATARAHSGPGSTSGSASCRALGLADPTAAFVAEPGQKRSLLITQGRHSGAAELFLLRTPPSPHHAAPRLFPLGRARGEGGALGSRAACFGLTFRAESPGAPWRSSSGWASGPQLAASPGRDAGPAAGDTACASYPGFFSVLIVGICVLFHNFSLKAWEP